MTDLVDVRGMDRLPGSPLSDSFTGYAIADPGGESVLAQILRQHAGEPGSDAGDAACWANLVCPECGAIESEGHRPGCGQGPAAS